MKWNFQDNSFIIVDFNFQRIEVMHFIHPDFVSGETIVARVTPPGEGGVAILRLSGDRAVAIGNELVSKNLDEAESHKVVLAKFFNAQAQVIDEGLVLVMRAPRSYTGEDCVELHCHGGYLIAQQLIEAALAKGARAAEAGEFTYKAYMNGRLDLAQAEAVAQLIHAKNEKALKTAQKQLEGSLSLQVKGFKEQLLEVAAEVEALIDFPEEGLPFSKTQALIGQLQSLQGQVQTLLDSYQEGRLVHEGLYACLFGRPNVGKSSLMNRLLKMERAIVTEVAGTTRDLLEESLHLAGFHLRLQDTAGIRKSEERIEAEGIARSWKAAKEADLILVVLDASAGLLEEDQEILSHCDPKQTLLIWNKVDLLDAEERSEKRVQLEGWPWQVLVSAKEGLHLERISEQLKALLSEGRDFDREVLITSARHKEALERSKQAISQVIVGLEQELSPELLSADLREAISQLGILIGAHVSEDILSAVFSKFCVGK